MAVKSKSYLNNPALQFISTALVDEASASSEPEAPAPVSVNAAPAAEPVRSAQNAPVPQYQYAPQMQQSYAQNVPVQENTSAKFIVPMKPVYVEVRSKRFNALMQPSLYNNLLKIATVNGISVNELMHRVLEKYVEDNMVE